MAVGFEAESERISLERRFLMSAKVKSQFISDSYPNFRLPRNVNKILNISQ